MSWKKAIGLLLVLFSLQAAAQRVAVKSNLLYLAAAAPDLGAELVVGEKTSLSISVFGTWSPYWRDRSLEGQPTKLLALQPEFRYWFNGRPLTRFYAGVYGLGAAYDFPFKEVVHKGTAAGAGLTVGYVFNLSKRLNLELSTGSGLLFYWGKRYAGEEGVTSQDGMPNTHGYKLAPGKLGISLVYIIR